MHSDAVALPLVRTLLCLGEPPARRALRTNPDD